MEAKADPREKRLRAAVRLYRFYNVTRDQNGEPFALCDLHHPTQRVPDMCILNKIADGAVWACVTCVEESNPDAP